MKSCRTPRSVDALDDGCHLDPFALFRLKPLINKTSVLTPYAQTGWAVEVDQGISVGLGVRIGSLAAQIGPWRTPWTLGGKTPFLSAPSYFSSTYLPGASSKGASPASRLPIAGGFTCLLECAASQACHSSHQLPSFCWAPTYQSSGAR